MHVLQDGLLVYGGVRSLADGRANLRIDPAINHTIEDVVTQFREGQPFIRHSLFERKPDFLQMVCSES